VLFVGDLFGWGLIPLSGPPRPRAVERLLATYARMIGFEADVVVPGHGPLCSTAELRRWVRYFRWLMRTAGEGIRAGKSDEDIRPQLALPHDMAGWWRFADWKHEDSIAKVLHAARKGWLDAEFGSAD